MRAHIVLAHPEPKSFNAHLSETTRRELDAAGWETALSDLYAMNFNPCEGPQFYASRQDENVFHAQSEQRHSADTDSMSPDIEAEIQHLLDCDLLVVHFPLWWFGPPAILKGWMDRVFVYGRMYRSAMRYDAGICAGKKMIACVTTGASGESCAHNGREGDTRLHLWPILFPFRYLGFEVLTPEIFHGVGGVAFIEGHEEGLSTLETFTARWTETLEMLPAREALQYNRDDEFDETKRLRPEARVHSPFIRHSPDAVSE